MLLCAVVAGVYMSSSAAVDKAQLRANRAKMMLKSNRLRLGSGVKTTPKWTWTTTVTTNELDQITKISTGVSTNGVTKTVCLVWNDNVVPLKYRETFLSMSDDAKGNALSLADNDLWTNNKTEGIVVPKEAPEVTTDDNITTEIREIQVRW
jgi:hypothetical protein